MNLIESTDMPTQIPDDEVILSVPAGKSYDLILKHKIYSCPDTDRYEYVVTNFMTFRSAEGWMERVFTIIAVHTVNPEFVSEARDLAPDSRNRIIAYCQEATHVGVLKHEGDYRFYFVEAHSALPLKPSTEPRPPGAAYYYYRELRGNQAVVPFKQ